MVDDKQDSIVLEKIFEDYRINSIYLKLDEKYKKTLIDRIVYDYRVMDQRGFKTSKWDTISSFFLKVLIILGGAFLSSVKTYFVRRGIKFPSRGNKSTIIAMPFADRITRFLRLREIAGQEVDMYYHPLFRFDSMKSNIDDFNKTNQELTLDRFRIVDILYTFLLILWNYRLTSRCSSEMGNYFKSNTCKLPGVIIFGVLYSKTLCRFIKKLENPKKKRVWLLDYDFDFKYAIFNNVIHRLRPSDKTIHMQHGSFVGYSPVYCNPSSDISLCCSPREKELIKKYNDNNAIIEYLGAPLQSFIDHKTSINVNEEYDILILLSSILNDRLKNTQINFLSKFDFSKFRVKVRYRPASREDDIKVLGKYCEKAIISDKSTLLEDVMSSKTVISFSMDALYTCIRNNKKIIVVSTSVPDNDYDFTKKTNNIFITDDSTIAQKYDWYKFVHSSTVCDYANDQFVLYNYGINNIDALSDRFKLILKEICR